jgi:hypothetical protein
MASTQKDLLGRAIGEVALWLGCLFIVYVLAVICATSFAALFEGKPTFEIEKAPYSAIVTHLMTTASSVALLWFVLRPMAFKLVVGAGVGLYLLAGSFMAPSGQSVCLAGAVIGLTGIALRFVYPGDGAIDRWKARPRPDLNRRPSP